jgi:hypothetical protein
MEFRFLGCRSISATLGLSIGEEVRIGNEKNSYDHRRFLTSYAIRKNKNELGVPFNSTQFYSHNHLMVYASTWFPSMTLKTGANWC